LGLDKQGRKQILGKVNFQKIPMDKKRRENLGPLKWKKLIQGGKFGGGGGGGLWEEKQCLTKTEENEKHCSLVWVGRKNGGLRGGHEYDQGGKKNKKGGDVFY